MTTASPTTPSTSDAQPSASHEVKGPPTTGDPRDVVRVGSARHPLQDLYHFLLVASWRRLLFEIAAVYTMTNALFACLYLAGGDCLSGARPGSFSDAFFFSVQTFSTIGYGVMAPRTAYASVVVTFEAFIGLTMVAMVTGLIFAKFSRPTARILFADRLVVGVRNGKPTLMLRMANERGNDVIEASFRMTVLMPEITREGETLRRLFDLDLLRSDTPLFTVSFTAFHEINETSPLCGETQASFESKALRFIVTVTGHDGTYAQTIHARRVYFGHEVAWNARYVDVLSSGPDGRLQIDLSKFHDTMPL